MNFVVLSSSRGTTFQAVLDAMKDGSLTAQCLGLVTDRPDRGCVEKAKKADIPVKIVELKLGESREKYEKWLHEGIISLLPLAPNQASSSLTPAPTLIIALGWLHILSPWFIRQWKDRIINVHPALLPKYGGQGMYGDKVHEAVLKAEEKETGITIHFMDEGIDTGPIIVQKKCSVFKSDTIDKLKSRVQKLEREWIPKVLQMIERGGLNSQIYPSI